MIGEKNQQNIEKFNFYVLSVLFEDYELELQDVKNVNTSIKEYIFELSLDGKSITRRIVGKSNNENAIHYTFKLNYKNKANINNKIKQLRIEIDSDMKNYLEHKLSADERARVAQAWQEGEIFAISVVTKENNEQFNISYTLTADNIYFVEQWIESLNYDELAEELNAMTLEQPSFDAEVVSASFLSANALSSSIDSAAQYPLPNATELAEWDNGSTEVLASIVSGPESLKSSMSGAMEDVELAEPVVLTSLLKEQKPEEAQDVAAPLHTPRTYFLSSARMIERDTRSITSSDDAMSDVEFEQAPKKQAVSGTFRSY